MAEPIGQRYITGRPTWRIGDDSKEARMIDEGIRAPPPSLSYLDTEKIKREHILYASTNPPVTTSINMTVPPPPPLISPSTTYSGPPPPYSYPSSAASSSIGARDPPTVSAPPHGYPSATESRQVFSDEKDKTTTQPARQTLPSISEALNGGGDHAISISSLLLSTAAPLKPTYSTQGPTSPLSRSYVESAPKPAADAYLPPTPATARSFESYERHRPPFSPRSNHYNHNRSPPGNSQPPEMRPKATGSPLAQTKSGVTHYQAPSPAYHQYQTHRSPPPTTPNYAPSSYQPAYAYPASDPPVNAYTSAIPPQAVRRPANIELDRAEEIRIATARDSPAPRAAYGESVKRHLDIFDIETSLNEIAEGSGHALDFARGYGIRAHQTQRSGPIPGSLPSLAECDDIIRQQQHVLDAMGRIRDVILRQQHALNEQKLLDQRNFKSAPSEADEDAQAYMDKIDGAGGFAGAEAKKRRGRAAPPGRCHSCNRAETPEWRRGPDGARTLCNACGLHYAKLQRKMDSKDSGAGPSKLRPKESAASSP